MYSPSSNNYNAGYDVMSVLNSNYITDPQKKEAIRTMGMSACQARCLSCSHCSHHAGK